jgi:hypothetical protein
MSKKIQMVPEKTGTIPKLTALKLAFAKTSV